MDFIVAPGARLRPRTFCGISCRRRSESFSMRCLLQCSRLSMILSSTITARWLPCGKGRSADAGGLLRHLRVGLAAAGRPQLSPAVRNEIAHFAANCRTHPRLKGSTELLLGTLFPQPTPQRVSHQSLEKLLDENGFDPELHEQICADLRTGRIGLAQNRLRQPGRRRSPLTSAASRKAEGRRVTGGQFRPIAVSGRCWCSYLRQTTYTNKYLERHQGNGLKGMKPGQKRSHPQILGQERFNLARSGKIRFSGRGSPFSGRHTR